ncbi:hypothetical protein N1851_013935 [Merluccius polli]|uniref:Uncharacterized protein n=1 Tax=Merluccius polli TaxID=89951 RepID=A0AA47MU82_MERPO|nr:hypothetical protein N1851_013935 [Merluccius polli]
MSRGLKVKELMASNWFTGPDFLWHDEFPSGDIKVGDIAVEDPDVRKAFVHKTLTTEDSLLDRFLKFSSWTSLVKAIARLMQRAKELKGFTSRTKPTSLKERRDAESIIGIVQRATFSEETEVDSALDDQGKRLTKTVYLERPIHKTVTLIKAE